tara:strand:+ start:134 stop:454 length:321 start_codon:yes stop_codon:yes gene_type:complete
MIYTTNTLIPVEITDTRQSRNQKEKFKTISFWDTANRREVKTHIVSSYGNYTRWKKVLNQGVSDDACILTGDFKYKDIDVIDADSTFVMHTGVSWNDVAEIIDANN